MEKLDNMELMEHKTCGRRKETRVELTHDVDDGDSGARETRKHTNALTCGRRKSILAIEDMTKVQGVSY